MEDGAIVVSGSIEEMLTRLDLLLSTGAAAASTLDTTVCGHDADYGLLHLDSEGIDLSLSAAARPAGEHVRLKIAARDVSITLEQQIDTSIQNILPATVKEITHHGAEVTVRLSLGHSPLLARITRKSADTLALEAGKKVYAQVKSIALLS